MDRNRGYFLLAYHSVGFCIFFLLLDNSLSFIRLCSQLKRTVCISVLREMLWETEQAKHFEIHKFGLAFRELRFENA